MDSVVLEKYLVDYGTKIFTFCVYLTRNKHDAQDLYQQTFLVACEKKMNEELKNPKSYLLSIAVNLYKNQTRKKLWRKNKADIIYYLESDLERIADESHSVEEQILRQEEVELVRKYMEELPDKMRIAVLLYYKEHMAIDEIATVLKIPSGTVKSRLHHAKMRLKERMMLYETED